MAIFSQRLKHGKALCEKVFSAFVETFNALVVFKDNLKGDAEVNGELGHIKVDRTDPSHPILRCKGCKANGDSGEEEPEDPGENTECVTSLNDLKGDVTIIGGKGIRVDVQGQTIRISFDQEKDYEDEDPNAEGTQDPCEHPGSVQEGGVSSDNDNDNEHHDAGGAVGAASGGVPAEGESHPGDPCNCN